MLMNVFCCRKNYQDFPQNKIMSDFVFCMLLCSAVENVMKFPFLYPQETSLIHSTLSDNNLGLFTCDEGKL